MRQKIKKIMSFSAFVFVFGFLGGFLGKNVEKSKIGQSVEKKMGLKTDEAKKISQTSDCIEQGEKDNSAVFVGCNGFF